MVESGFAEPSAAASPTGKSDKSEICSKTAVASASAPPPQRRHPAKQTNERQEKAKDLGPGWCGSINTKPPAELVNVVKSNKTSKNKAVWGSSVDDWLVRRGFSILPELSEEDLDEIAEVFNLLDDDGSGALDADELLIGFSLMGSRVDETQLRALIRQVDFDGSGEIELDEFEVIMGSKKQFSKLKGIDENGDEQEAVSSGDDDDSEFNSTWARGLRRKKMISAIQDGGESRIRLVRMAIEAEEETKMTNTDREAAREAEEAKSGKIFGKQLTPKASAAVAAAAAAAAAATMQAGLPPVPLKFLHDKGSGSAVLHAIEVATEERARETRAASRMQDRMSQTPVIKYDAWGNVIKRKISGGHVSRRETLGVTEAGSDDEDIGKHSDSDESSDGDKSPAADGRSRPSRAAHMSGRVFKKGVGRRMRHEAGEPGSTGDDRGEQGFDWSFVKSRVGDVGRRRRQSRGAGEVLSTGRQLFAQMSKHLSRRSGPGRVNPEQLIAATAAITSMLQTSASVAPSRPSFAQVLQETAEAKAAVKRSEVPAKPNLGFESAMRRLAGALALKGKDAGLSRPEEEVSPKRHGGEPKRGGNVVDGISAVLSPNGRAPASSSTALNLKL
jgi:hypothetical protein